ncbi:hypothetical protein OSB04_001986 [Centaurea solstitialis]|uniref:Helicase-like transcription factor CHR28 n=1 Tax=Centaurea solstitialis TaxID=347529 RepID=A0AA38U3R5_9ASTR|nr:hypothetical protein OSB04_001986 [Centaurea solstitialis]
MADGDYEWRFDDDDDGFDVTTANDDEPVDFESLFNTLAEKSRGDYSQIVQYGPADPSSSIAQCSESVSGVGVNELSQTHDGLLAFPPSYHSEASASGTFCASDWSVTEKQKLNSGFENLEYHQDMFPMHSDKNVSDWQMPVPSHVTPWLENHGVPQDFFSFSNHGTETDFERASSSETFGFTNGSHQPMGISGITNGILADSIRNIYQTSEAPYNLEVPSMDFNGYSDIHYGPSHEFSLPYATSTDEPPYFGSSRQIESLIYNDGMLFDVETESKEHLMQNLSRNIAMDYEPAAIRPGGVAAAVDWNSDIGSYVDAAGIDNRLSSGESPLGEHAKGSTSGRHWFHMGNMANKTQVAWVKDEKNDVPIPSLGTACKIQPPLDGKPHIHAQASTLGAPPTRMQINHAKLDTIDEQSHHQAPLQDLFHRKSDMPLPNGGLTVPLLRHQGSLNSKKRDTFDYTRVPGSPKGGKIACKLADVERIALSWMTRKETKSTRCCGGILADDQGLGKTISAIVLILKERSPPSSGVCTIQMKEQETETLNLDEDEEEDKDTMPLLDKSTQDVEHSLMATNGSSIKHTNTPVQTKSCVAAGTLVVCPTSVLRQWNEELQTKVNSKANLSVLVYHGPNRTKDPFELAKYDVVLTTYAIVSMEVPKQPLVDEDDDETKKRSDSLPIKLSPGKKRKYPPTSDESSRKDKKGTDNEPSELVDRPLAKLRWFRVILDEAQSIKNYKTQVARACWGLRAKRRWCLSGTPIQNSIDDLYSYFRFLRYDPLAVFKSFCSAIKAPIQRNPVAGYKKLQVILKTIMLRRTKGTLLKGEPIISLPPKTIVLKKVDFTAEERGFYRSLEADSRAQFAKYAAAGTVKQNYINILLMLLRLRQACDHPLLVRGCSSSTGWRLSVEKAKELPQEILSGLLKCLEASLAICGICNDPPEDAVVTTCKHVFCNQCILEHLSSDDSHCPSAECKALITRSSVFSKSTLEVAIGNQPGQLNQPHGSENWTIGPSGSLKIEANKALESSKIKAALEFLRSISKPRDTTVAATFSPSSIGGNPESLLSGLSGVFEKEVNIKGNSVKREKAIVFSQWTGMLDFLEVCLKDSSIGYRRLDGTMSVVARDKAVKDFNTLPEVTVMIMSLKAASLGLNMVAACHVILLDLWWNPTTEDQAIDRAHRIGQTRPVTVLRLTVKDTIEDRILALQVLLRALMVLFVGCLF